jgi:hypothetical protein
MAIQREIWQDHIEGNLFKNNEVLLSSSDASQYVLQGKVVHIPQAGAGATITKNVSSLPVTVVQRTDTDITYPLDQYTSAPILITNAETIELSYNKREQVLGEYQSSLRETVAENILYSWAPTAASVSNIIRSTGAATTSHLSGTTGNRNKFGVADLKKAGTVLDKQNISMEGRVALISADMFSQLTDDMSATQYRDFSAAYDVKNGKLGRLFGFDIYMRATTVVYDNTTGTPMKKAVGAASAVDDNDTVLCWQVNAVERAQGEIKFFEKVGDPQYYGDIYSLLVRMGSRIRRIDEKGIVAIVQGVPSGV